MNFYNKISSRWTGEQLASWSSAFKILYLLFPLLVYYLVGDLVEILLWWLLDLSLSGVSTESIESMAAYGSTIQGIIYGLGLVAGAVIIRKATVNEITYREQGEDIGQIKPIQWITIVIVSLAFSVGFNYLYNILGITEASETFKSVRENQLAVNFAAGIFIYGILSPMVEEMIFRGLLFNRLKRVFPKPLWAVILSALLFGVFHGNLVQGSYAFLMGIIIALLYQKYKNFLVPVAAHMVANLGVYVLQYTIWK